MVQSDRMLQAALGCRSHSGWAVLVAMTGDPGSPQVILRRRIEIADPAIRGSKQPYHAAEPLDLRDAEALLKRCATSSLRLAEQAIRETINDLRAQGYEITSFSVTLGSGRPLPGLEAILKSHALIHTAEGEFFRHALVNAGRQCGLAVIGFKEREIFGRAVIQLRIANGELERRITALGKTVGPPWSQDQKLSALAAWLSLAHSPAER